MWKNDEGGWTKKKTREFKIKKMKLFFAKLLINYNVMDNDKYMEASAHRNSLF